MTRPTPASGAPLDSVPARPWFWVVPALTFAVGLLLGGTVMATAGDPKDDAAAAPRPVTTATVSPAASSGDRTITVPASCEQGLQRARTALSTVGEAVEAARNLNSRRLQELLDRLQQAQREVQALAEQCRAEVPDRN